MGVTVRQHNGSWFAFVNHRGRRKAHAFGKDKRAAESFATQLRAKLAAGEDLTPAATKVVTFREYADGWLRTHAGQVCKQSTQALYAQTLALYILPALGTRPLAGIVRADCRNLLAGCRSQDLSSKTLLNIARLLSSVLSGAVEDGYLDANPAFRLGKFCRRDDVVPFRIDPFTKDECVKFLSAAKGTAYYPLFLTALRTGMRLGELLALEWGDIDFAGRFIVVQRARVRGVLTTPKNRQARRVDMSTQLSRELQHLLAIRKAAKLANGWDELPATVFIDQDRQPLDGDHVRKVAFYKTLAKAGLRHVRFHDLRHTFASLLIQAGESLAYIRDQLGHHSIKLTVDVYGHLVPGANRAAVDRLDDAEAK